MWYEKKKRFIDGVNLISSKFSDEEFSVALKKYSSSTNIPSTPIEAINLSPEECLLVSKTLFYIVQRLGLFLLSPVKLQSDLSDLGFTQEKAEIIVKLYSESNRNIMKNLKTEESSENDGSISWEVKTSLFEDNVKCKKQIARLSLKVNDQEVILDELNHSDLLSLFDDFETIQRELDALSANKK